MDVFEAERLTDELISAELAKQNQMWGRMNERADISQGQLFHAAPPRSMRCSIARTANPTPSPRLRRSIRRTGADSGTTARTSQTLWWPCRFFTQEIKRKLLAGEDYTRLSRGADQVYRPETGLPNLIEA